MLNNNGHDFRLKVGLAEMLKGGVIMDVMHAAPRPLKRQGARGSDIAAKAIVLAATHLADAKILAEVSEQMTRSMEGLSVGNTAEAELLHTRGGNRAHLDFKAWICTKRRS